MGDAEFWRTTPRQFDARLSRHLAERDRADYRAGVIAAIIATVHAGGKKGKKGFKPSDFFPNLKHKGGG